MDPGAAGEALPRGPARILAILGSRASTSLLRQFQAESDPRPRLTPSKVAAYLLAVAVHLTTVLLAVAGVLALLSGNIMLAAVGVLLLAMAWLFRPRIAKGPPLQRAEPAALRRLADEVADAVGTRRADAIVVTTEFNASVTAVGWRRRQVLSVGLPLFAVLSAQERVALLAHEFGHFRNGDPRRGFVVGTAFDSLVAWYAILSPDSADEGRDYGDLGLLALPVNLILWLLSLLPLVLASVLAMLISRESQRGEYLADAIAARVAGSAAVVSLFDKFRLEPIYLHAAAAKSAAHWHNGSAWDDLRQRAARYPESELRRARLRDRRLATRLDLSHPPTADRIDAISARPPQSKLLNYSEPKSEQLDDELRQRLTAMQPDLIDQHLDSLYAG